MTCDVKDNPNKISTLILDSLNLPFLKKFSVFILVLICIISSASNAQSNTGTITGIVVDANTGEAVIGANVAIEGTTNGAATDIDGKYTIRDLEPGTYFISVSFISHEKTITGLQVLLE